MEAMNTVGEISRCGCADVDGGWRYLTCLPNIMRWETGVMSAVAVVDRFDGSDLASRIGIGC